MDGLNTIQIEGVEILNEVNLERYTTIKLGSTGSIAIVKNVTALKSLIDTLNSKSISFHMVGWGANQVLLNCEQTLFIKLDFDFDKSYLAEPKEEYVLPASLPLNLLTSHAGKFGLKGWEVFTGVPASLGGAIFMNAGTALGEIGDLIKSVKILMPSGGIRTHECGKGSFSYRRNNFVEENEIIIEATMFHCGIDEKIKSQIKEYLNYRKTTQPLTTKNCGSVYKNYSPEARAGATIEAIGLKEFGFDNLKVSRKHANFIENTGGATSTQFKELTTALTEEMERYSGLKFELEVNIY